MGLAKKDIKRKVYNDIIFGNTKSDIVVDRFIIYIGDYNSFGDVLNSRYNISLKTDISNIIEPHILFKTGESNNIFEYKYEADNNSKYSICILYNNEPDDKIINISVISSKTDITINPGGEVDQEYSITYEFKDIKNGFYMMTAVYVNSMQPPLISLEKILDKKGADTKLELYPHFDLDMNYIYNILDEKYNNNMICGSKSLIKVTKKTISTNQYQMMSPKYNVEQVYTSSSLAKENVVNFGQNLVTQMPIFDHYSLLGTGLTADCTISKDTIIAYYNGIAIDEFSVSEDDYLYSSIMCNLFKNYIENTHEDINNSALELEDKFNCSILLDSNKQMIVNYFDNKEKDQSTISLTFSKIINQNFDIYNIILKEGDKTITNYTYEIASSNIMESFNGVNSITYMKSYVDNELTSNNYIYQDNNYCIDNSKGYFEFNSSIYDNYLDENVMVRFGYLGLPIGKKNAYAVKYFEDKSLE